MPQNAMAATVAVNPSGQQAPVHIDAANSLKTCTAGANSTYDITANTNVKAAPGRVARVSVIVAGSAAGAVYDDATTSGEGATNQVFVIPNTVGVYALDWECVNGITVAPGTGQTVAVNFD